MNNPTEFDTDTDSLMLLDLLERERVAVAHMEDAREEWKRQAKHWAAVRAGAVQELKRNRTWAEVAELLGVSEGTAWNIAHPGRKGQDMKDYGLERHLRSKRGHNAGGSVDDAIAADTLKQLHEELHAEDPTDHPLDDRRGWSYAGG